MQATLRSLAGSRHGARLVASAFPPPAPAPTPQGADSNPATNPAAAASRAGASPSPSPRPRSAAAAAPVAAGSAEPANSTGAHAAASPAQPGGEPPARGAARAAAESGSLAAPAPPAPQGAPSAEAGGGAGRGRACPPLPDPNPRPGSAAYHALAPAETDALLAQAERLLRERRGRPPRRALAPPALSASLSPAPQPGRAAPCPSEPCDAASAAARAPSSGAAAEGARRGACAAGMGGSAAAGVAGAASHEGRVAAGSGQAGPPAGVAPAAAAYADCGAGPPGGRQGLFGAPAEVPAAGWPAPDTAAAARGPGALGALGGGLTSARSLPLGEWRAGGAAEPGAGLSGTPPGAQRGALLDSASDGASVGGSARVDGGSLDYVLSEAEDGAGSDAGTEAASGARRDPAAAAGVARWTPRELLATGSFLDTDDVSELLDTGLPPPGAGEGSAAGAEGSAAGACSAGSAPDSLAADCGARRSLSFSSGMAVRAQLRGAGGPEPAAGAARGAGAPRHAPSAAELSLGAWAASCSAARLGPGAGAWAGFRPRDGRGSAPASLAGDAPAVAGGGGSGALTPASALSSAVPSDVEDEGSMLGYDDAGFPGGGAAARDASDGEDSDGGGATSRASAAGPGPGPGCGAEHSPGGKGKLPLGVAEGLRRRASAELCAICMDAPLQVAVGGCAHALCRSCAYQLCARGLAAPACPFCRGPISGFRAHQGSQP